MIGEHVDEADFIKQENRGPIFRKEALNGLVRVPGGVVNVFNFAVKEIGEESKEGFFLRRVLEEENEEWVPIREEDYLSGGNHFSDSPFSEILSLALARIVGRQGKSWIVALASKNGLTGWKVRREPVFSPESKECYGWEDPRIHKIFPFGLVVTAVHHYRNFYYGNLYQTDIFRIANLETFEMEWLGTPGFINKDTVLLEEKVGGEYMAYRRPEIAGRYHITCAFSQDLNYWRFGREPIVAYCAGSELWNEKRVGKNASPILIQPTEILPEGAWLSSIHGADSKFNYYISFQLMDRKEPWRVTHSLPFWVIDGELGYSRGISGVQGAVFSCAFMRDPPYIRVYYSLFDKESWVSFISEERLIELLLQYPAD